MTKVYEVFIDRDGIGEFLPLGLFTGKNQGVVLQWISITHGVQEHQRMKLTERPVVEINDEAFKTLAQAKNEFDRAARVLKALTGTSPEAA